MKEWRILNEMGSTMGYIYADTYQEACEKADKFYTNWSDMEEQ